eukprot:gene5829-6070_t
MAEVALAAAFEAELGKHLKSLPGVPELSDHEAVVHHQRCALKLDDLINHYMHRLSPYALATHLLQTGEELARRQEHILAARCCFDKLVALNLPSVPKLSKLDGVGALALHLQAALDALDGMRQACSRAQMHEQLYWLVHNGTLRIYQVADKLSFLRVAYSFNQQELLQKLVVAAKVRGAGVVEENAGAKGASQCLVAVAVVLQALQHLHQGLLLGVAARLHATAAPLLQSCFSTSDGETELVFEVLEALHVALQAADSSDGILRGSVAIRLALLLEEQNHISRARDVIRQALEAITAARSDALTHIRGAADEHLRWITASKTQATAELATLISGMTYTEQELACLHAEAFLVQQRLELVAGLQEAADNAAAAQQQMVQATARIDQQSNIYGVRTQRDKRADEAAVKAAGKKPTANPVVERQLLLQCGKNYSQRALLLTQIAAYQPDSERQQSLLAEACDLLMAAPKDEMELFKMQQLTTSGSRKNLHQPHQPTILCRSPNSITLANSSLDHLLTASTKAPVKYAAYCKATGAGVQLTLNKTAMEYPGCGVLVSLGERIAIGGLQANQTYLFAIAAYDEDGRLVGELGLSTTSVLMALPLPLHACWAHVLLTAACLHHWALAKRAAEVLFQVFTSSSKARPLWEAHPMDRHVLQMQQVALIIDDEALAEEGALRCYNLLVPFLSYKDISPLLLKPLTFLLHGLQAIKVHNPGKVMAGNQQRVMAARVTAAVSYWLMKVNTQSHDVQDVSSTGDAGTCLASRCGHAAAGTAHLEADLLMFLRTAARHLQPQAAAELAQSAEAHGPQKQGTGSSRQQVVPAVVSPPVPDAAACASSAAEQQPAVLEELRAAEELALMHPDGQVWAAPWAAARLADVGDLPAQVLSKLNQPDLLPRVWALLSSQAARKDHRWLPLCVLVLEAAAQQYGAALLLAMPPSQSDGLGAGLSSALVSGQGSSSPVLLTAASLAAEIIAAVNQHVRLSARKPQLLDWGINPKWTVKGAVAALQASNSLTGEQHTAAQLAGAEVSAEASAEELRQLAVVLLLQQRLPVLLRRRRMILQARQQMAAWCPWLSRMHALLGGLAAEAASCLLSRNPSGPAAATGGTCVVTTDADNEYAAAASGDIDIGAASEGQAGDGSAGIIGTETSDSKSESGISSSSSNLRPPSPERRAEGFTPRKKDRAAKTATPREGRLGRATQGCKDGTEAEVAECVDDVELAQQLSIQAIAEFAKAATLACRAGPTGHQQLFISCKQLWCIASVLINRQPNLTLPLRPVVWAVGVLPAPKVPPLAAEPLERMADSTAATGAKSAEAGGKGKGGAGDKKGSAAGKAGKAEGKKDTGTKAVKAGAVPAVEPPIIKQLVMPEARTGNIEAAFRTADMLMGPTKCAAQASYHQYPAVLTDAPSAPGSITARSNRQSSEFSFGSDAVTQAWHARCSVDVVGLTKGMQLVLQVLQRMERWHSMMSIGSADGALLPLMLTAATKAGAETELAEIQSASEAFFRSKNTAIDALDQDAHGNKQKGVDKPAAGTAALLARSFSNSIKRAAAPPYIAGQRQASHRAPDHMLLVAEYGRVVEQFKKRGEKAHMILALNELGDVWAHAGDWPQAEQAWSSALDALLGPYQVMTNWSATLQLGSWAELLGRYGVHGLLQAAVLAGKLARYCFPRDLSSRLSCARLVAALLPGVFAADVIHPQRCRDCALHVPTEIWPGRDVFDDPYRSNAYDLTASLETVCSILFEHQLHLQMLPLLSMWEHTALHVAHQTESVVWCRTVRVKTLAQLGLLAEAGRVLQDLLQGSRLPGKLLSAPQPVLGTDGQGMGIPEGTGGGSSAASGSIPGKETNTAATGKPVAARLPVFHAAMWPAHAINAAFIDWVLTAELAACLSQAYGPWLCGQLEMARAAWLTAASSPGSKWLYSSDGTPAGAASASPVAVATTPGPKGGSHSAASGSKGIVGTIAAGMDTVMLERGIELLQGVVLAAQQVVASASSDLAALSWEQEDCSSRSSNSSAAKDAGKFGKGSNKAEAGTGAKGNQVKGKLKSAGRSLPSSDVTSDVCMAPPAPDVVAANVQLMVDGLLLLGEAKLQCWQPYQALHIYIAASAAITASASISNTSLATAAAGNKHHLEQSTLQPGAWLKARLQLRHYPTCVAVCQKALQDAEAVAGLVWAVQLQQVLAHAQGAQGNVAAALDTQRGAMTRLHPLAWTGPLLLSVQLDYCLLCEEVNARAEFDRQIADAHQVSTRHMEELGLQEMLEYPGQLSIYLHATHCHLTTTILAATAATRRRQLATAEKLLRRALVLLQCCRTTAVEQAQVHYQLAQPVQNIGSWPAWLQESLRRQEQLQLSLQQEAAAAAANTAARCASGMQEQSDTCSEAVKSAAGRRCLHAWLPAHTLTLLPLERVGVTVLDRQPLHQGLGELPTAVQHPQQPQRVHGSKPGMKGFQAEPKQQQQQELLANYYSNSNSKKSSSMKLGILQANW